MEIILIIIAVLLLIFIALGIESTIKILYPKMKTDEHFKEMLIKYNQYDEKWYNSLEKEEFYLKSQFGYDIHLTYVKNPVPTGHTIIICHGVTSRTDGVIKFLNMFIKNGYNALFIDHRAHGETGGKKVSYGYFERYDLAKAIKWAREQNGGKIGMIGESMGAGILMQTLLVEKADFIIEDCGYSSFDDEVKHQLKRVRFAPVYPTYFFTRAFVRLFGGYDIKRVSPVEALKQTDIPVMVIHGEKDDYVPFYMSSIIFNAVKSSYKMMYAAKDSKHAYSYEDHPEEYQMKVYEFLKSCDMPHADEFTL